MFIISSAGALFSTVSHLTYFEIGLEKNKNTTTVGSKFSDSSDMCASLETSCRIENTNEDVMTWVWDFTSPSYSN